MLKIFVMAVETLCVSCALYRLLYTQQKVGIFFCEQIGSFITKIVVGFTKFLQRRLCKITTVIYKLSNVSTVPIRTTTRYINLLLIFQEN